MSCYKIFATDLDGTLLNDSLEIGEKNLAAIKLMTDRGIEFLPVTGRCLVETPKEIIESEYVRYIINSNGASVYNTRTKASHTIPIKTETVKKLLDILSNYSVLIAAHSNNNLFVDEDDRSEEVFFSHRMSKEYKDIILPVSTPVKDFKNRLVSDIPAEMLCLFFKYENERQECFEIFGRISDINATSSIGGNMEVLNGSVSKGGTLKNVAAALGVNPSEIIAAGDNHNDLSLTKDMGLSLAVSNAVEEMKRSADKVICSNNENIAEYVYKNFIE